MRKTLSILAITAAALTAAPYVAMAAPLQDQVGGKGTVATLGFSARVDARSGPQGETPRGTFTVDYANSYVPDRQVHVSCLVVVGNTAVVGGLDSTGGSTFLKIADNGTAGDQMEVAIGQGGTAPDQQTCAAVGSSFTVLFPVTSGDFTVVDN